MLCFDSEQAQEVINKISSLSHKLESWGQVEDRIKQLIVSTCTAEWFDSLTVADQMRFYAELKDFGQGLERVFYEMIRNLRTELLKVVRQSIKDQKHTFHSYVLFLESLGISESIVMDFYSELTGFVHLNVVGWTAQFIGKIGGREIDVSNSKVVYFAGRIMGITYMSERLVLHVDHPVISYLYYDYFMLIWKAELTKDFVPCVGEVSWKKT